MRIFSGIQPTGSVHIGNYLGAIKNWVSLQNQEQPKKESLFCIVDLHALTNGCPDPAQLRYNVRLMAACYVACGIDPIKATVFVQSHVSAHSEMAWLLSCITPLGWLNRMTQFKDKAGKHKEAASLGLYAYPVLMAADILTYKATHVPVGADQKQHLELARDIAGAFNRLAPSLPQGMFPLPEPCILGAATRIMSLKDGQAKMGKSDPSDFSRIHLLDTPEEIEAKIRKAKTDSDLLPDTLDALENRAEAKNLLTIYAALTDQPLAKALATFSGQNFSGLKKNLSEALVATLTPIRVHICQLLEDPLALDSILHLGAERAHTIANQTMKEVKEIMGL